LRSAVIAILVCAVAAPAAAAVPARARTGAPPIGIFYYPWYGTPARDGAYEHWQQRAHRPPLDIASNYFPTRGAYSSDDPRVLAAQMREIAAAGIGVVVVSWWGRGSPEDERLPAVAAAARRRGLGVAINLEPYHARDARSIAADIRHLRTLGIRDVYVYAPLTIPRADWVPLTDSLHGVRLLAQTGLVGWAASAGFDGVYTYDILGYGPSTFARLCGEAHAVGLLCEPSVGPGYAASRATGDRRVKPRRDGRTYDEMWRAALASNADAVTITSYNEWHEGTQIEPARERFGYLGYDGAWGRSGAPASRAYLDRTAYWAQLFTLRRAMAKALAAAPAPVTPDAAPIPSPPLAERAAPPAARDPRRQRRRRRARRPCTRTGPPPPDRCPTAS
jgi:hypothetical protein